MFKVLFQNTTQSTGLRLLHFLKGFFEMKFDVDVMVEFYEEGVSQRSHHDFMRTWSFV